jgi:folate-binding protein YgfZ
MPESTPLHALTTEAGAAMIEEAGWEVPGRFGDGAGEYEQAVGGCVLFDTSHTGKIELTGGDATTFMHNLSTNSITDLPLGGGCESFLTTAKARIVSHVFVYHLQLSGGRPALWLDVPPGTAEAVIKHLDHFLISEQVEMADRTREFGQVHLAGPRAKDVLKKALADDVPELEELQHMMRTFGTNGTGHVRRRSPLGLLGYDIVCLRSRIGAVWKMFVNAGARPAGRDTWEVLRVEAGTPVLGVDFDETTFVPEVDRAAQAISYSKGCYLGQEPIVMARDRGQVNRHLRGIKLEGEPVAHDTRLFAGDKEVGRITSCVRSPRLGTVALGYVRRGHQEPGTGLEVHADNRSVRAEVAVLPFVKP